MTDTTKRIPHSECVQGRCASLTTGCWGECSIRAAFPLNNVACGDPATPSPRVSEQADAIQRIVDRDTPPDNRGEVVDYDIRGKPITRGDIARFTVTQQSAPEAPASERAYDLEEDRIDNALANFLAEHTRLSQDGIDTHAITMTLAINHAALKPASESDIAEWYEQGYLARPAATTASASGEAFKLAVDAMYPIPDSPHTSVMQRAADNRLAFWHGWLAAKHAATPEPSREPAPQAAAEIPAHPGIKTWQDRFVQFGGPSKEKAMLDEIADLRTALAQQSAEKGAAS